MEKSLNTQICELIKHMRAKYKMSLEEFSKATGFSVARLRRMEAGTEDIYMNDIDQLRAFANFKYMNLEIEIIPMLPLSAIKKTKPDMPS